jgi:hypothetical protein
MSHYAKVLNGEVIQVIVAEASFFDTFVDDSPGQWIKTSYNTRGNVHYKPNSNEPSGDPPLRGNFAGIGYTYDAENDVFYAPQPGPQWVLNRSTWLWEEPLAE